MPASSVTHNPAGVACVFDEASHTYRTDQMELVSVTRFVKHFFPEFDAPAVAARVAARDGKAVEAVLAEWEAKRNAAARLGTRVHEVAEDLILGRAPRHTPESERERALMAAVWEHVARRKADGWKPVGAEMVVFSESLRLAGCIDLVMRDPAGNLWLLDWKTNERIDMSGRSGGKGYSPVETLEDCNLVHYSLQLATYERILRHGGYIDRDEPIFHDLLHVTENGIEAIECKDVSAEVAEMLIVHITESWEVPF